MLTLRQIEAIVIYAEKHLNNATVLNDIHSLHEHILIQNKEISFLKERLFHLEQMLPDEIQAETILATKIEDAILKNKKEFLEIQNSINNDIWIITIHKKFGKSVKQLLDESEIRRLKAENKFKSVLKEIEQYKHTIAWKTDQINALQLLQGTDIEVNRKIIKDATNKLAMYYHRFNMKFIQAGRDKLHESFFGALNEALHRASNAEYTAKYLRTELNRLKRKNFHNFRFSKRRTK
jgi:hypothetical protein